MRTKLVAFILPLFIAVSLAYPVCAAYIGLFSRGEATVRIKLDENAPLSFPGGGYVSLNLAVAPLVTVEDPSLFYSGQVVYAALVRRADGTYSIDTGFLSKNRASLAEPAILFAARVLSVKKITPDEGTLYSGNASIMLEVPFATFYLGAGTVSQARMAFSNSSAYDAYAVVDIGTWGARVREITVNGLPLAEFVNSFS